MKNGPALRWMMVNSTLQASSSKSSHSSSRIVGSFSYQRRKINRDQAWSMVVLESSWSMAMAHLVDSCVFLSNSCPRETIFIIQQCFTDDLFSHRSSKSPIYIAVMLGCWSILHMVIYGLWFINTPYQVLIDLGIDLGYQFFWPLISLSCFFTADRPHHHRTFRRVDLESSGRLGELHGQLGSTHGSQSWKSNMEIVRRTSWKKRKRSCNCY